MSSPWDDSTDAATREDWLSGRGGPPRVFDGRHGDQADCLAHAALDASQPSIDPARLVTPSAGKEGHRYRASEMNYLTYWLRNLAERRSLAEHQRVAREVAEAGKARRWWSRRRAAGDGPSR
jgi:hypothetical protein